MQSVTNLVLVVCCVASIRLADGADDSLSTVVSNPTVELGDGFTVQCVSNTLMDKVVIDFNGEEIFKIDRFGLEMKKIGGKDFLGNAKIQNKEGTNIIDKAYLYSPPFTASVDIEGADEDVEGSYECKGHITYETVEDASVWWKIWTWGKRIKTYKTMDYTSKPVSVVVNDDTPNVAQKPPPVENLPLNPILSLINSPTVRESITAPGTLQSDDYEPVVATSSPCMRCESSFAVDNNRSTIFKDVCLPKLETHWITVILEKEYMDIRVKVIPSGDRKYHLRKLLVGVFEASNKKMDRLCIRNAESSMYFCSNPTPRKGIIVYQKKCLKFADIIVYTGAQEALEHCHQKYDGTNKKYRGYLSSTMDGEECDDWENHEEYYKPPAIEGPYCRTPEEKQYLWCFTGPGKNDWNYCNYPPHCDEKFQISVI